MDNNTNLMNTEDYGLSFSEEVIEKIQAFFADAETQEMRTFAANVLIGNIPGRKAQRICWRYIRAEWLLRQGHKDNDGRTGKYITLFGSMNGNPCAYGSTSDKAQATPHKWI